MTFAPLPILAYRAYALFRAQYVLNRDSLELRWGLRDESIPLMDIEWVRPVDDLTSPLNAPSSALPGAVLGLRRHRDLGIVEFMASERKKLLLVATARRVYAISPADPAEFTQTFSRAVELGSLSTSAPKSVYPSFVLAEAWRSGLVRYLWLAALFLNIGLIVWTSLLIPSLSRVTFAFGPDRSGSAVPSTQLVILPLLSAFLTLAGWGGGPVLLPLGRAARPGRRHMGIQRADEPALSDRGAVHRLGAGLSLRSSPIDTWNSRFLPAWCLPSRPPTLPSAPRP